MKKAISVLLFVIQCAWSQKTADDQFNSLWYDGNAEISTYRLTESRYGEQRDGVRIMVFVTEPLRKTTLIKPDIIQPDSLVYKVIKINDLRKFVTGIYDYSVMTSTYSTVIPYGSLKPFSTVKNVFTGQEWCGTVFEELLRHNQTFQMQLNSYFESERTSTRQLTVSDSTQAEENLWIVIRELKGTILNPGESKKISVIPSSWSRRKAHVPANIVSVLLSKSGNQKTESNIGTIRTTLWTWAQPAGTTKVQVESDWPHRIISWQEPDGSHGEILSSLRAPYWELHKTIDNGYRAKLNLLLQSIKN
jgi:hypothetical protein